jgi:raffinose/stachyose/melibiose transport system permease protein
MSMPAVVLSLGFILFPLVAAIYLAFTNWNGLSATYGPFTGLANIRGMLHDSVLWAAVVNNLGWIIAGTLTPLLISLILAVLLWANTWGATIYRLVFLLPYIIPSVTIGIVWSWIYDPTNGWANRLLGDVGLGVLERSWLSDPATVLYAILFAAIWGATGFCTVVLSAALQRVNQELIDSSRIDGANGPQRLWHVILPQIAPVFMTLTTYLLIGGFSVFDVIFIMTQGGPDNASNVLGTYAWTQAFINSRIGYGTAIALLIAIFALPFVVILNRVQRRMSLQGLGA